MGKKEILRKKLTELTGGDFLVKNYSNLRKVFFNEEVFVGSKIEKNLIDKMVVWLLNMVVFGAFLVIIGYYLPGMVERLLPNFSGEIAKANDEFDVSEVIIWQPVLDERDKRRVKPEYDLDLKAGKWLKIPSASVEAQIMTNDEIENKKEVNKILDKGVYAYPDYAEMGWLGKTVILAGHHFNMAVGEKEGRRTFQNLNKVKVGDEVFLTDDYKKWKYEIYKIEKTNAITEKTADLIMYTCVFWWDSDLRLFVYGKIVED